MRGECVDVVGVDALRIGCDSACLAMSDRIIKYKMEGPGSTRVTPALEHVVKTGGSDGEDRSWALKLYVAQGLDEERHTYTTETVL